MIKILNMCQCKTAADRQQSVDW